MLKSNLGKLLLATSAAADLIIKRFVSIGNNVRMKSSSKNFIVPFSIQIEIGSVSKGLGIKKVALANRNRPPNGRKWGRI